MNETTLNDLDKLRYARHLALPGFDEHIQQRLKSARVVVIGAGGLGCPVLQYLTAAGIGSITVVDHDHVTLSNLQRQVLFTEQDIGQNKAICASEKLKALNSALNVMAETSRLDAGNAMQVLEGADVVVDCSDNFPTRYLLNDACVMLGVPLVQAAIFRHEGQISVFNFRQDINYRDAFPQPPAPDSVPDCAEGGVLGPLAGIIGSMQAMEVIKVLSGSEQTLEGNILYYDANTATSNIFALRINPLNHLRRAARERIELIDYEQFCGVTATEKKQIMIPEINVHELKALMDGKEDFQLIDVREPFEFDEVNLGGQLIPMNTVPEHIGEISRDRKVVIHCKAGSRSANVISWLQQNHGYTNLLNLKGGILEWVNQFGRP